MSARIFFSLFFLSTTFCAFSQNKNVILNEVLNSKEQDSTKINILNNLAKEIWKEKPDEAIQYINLAIEVGVNSGFEQKLGYSYYLLAESYRKKEDFVKSIQNAKNSINACVKVKDKKTAIKTYTLLAYIYQEKAKYTEAINYFQIALRIKVSIDDKRGAAYTLNEIGNVYELQGLYVEALNNFLSALKITEALKDSIAIADCHTFIGNIFYYQNNFNEALTHYKIAFQLQSEKQNNYGIADNSSNIGSVLQVLKKNQEARTYFLISLKTSEELNDENSIGVCYNNLGTTYFEDKQFILAEENYLKALEIQNRLGDDERIINCCINLGELYMTTKQYSLAKNYFARSIELCQKTANKWGFEYTYLYRSRMDSVLGDWNSAFLDKNLYFAYRDSLINEENTRKTVQAQMQYEFDGKAAATKAEHDKEVAIANTEIKKQRVIRNGFILGFALVLFFAGIFFSQRNRIKKEKQRSEDLLLNILPTEVAEELKSKGSADAKHYEEVTVLFTDFKGFTYIAQKLSAKDLVKEINECFSAFDAICEKYGIEKIKTIGDSFMAAGGLPVPNKTHAFDVVQAALEIRDYIHQKKQNSNGEHFEIRIGIHTGPVVAGIVGIKKFQYDIWGDTVNTASRMESSSDVGKVNISESTYNLVKDHFQCEYRGEIEAKGKGKIKMYFVEKS